MSIIIGLSSSSFYYFLILSLITLYIIVLITYKKKGNGNTKKCPLPPGPRPWPIVGNLPEFIMNKPSFKWIHGLMDELKAEIICIRLGNVHLIPVTSPEIAREFLKKKDIVFASRPNFYSAGIFSREFLATILSPYGDQWKKMRKILVSEVVSSARHQWLLGKRDEESDHLVRFLYNKCKKNEGLVNIRIVTQHYCGNITRKMVFGKRFFGKGSEDGGPGPEEEEHVTGIFTALKYLYAFCVSDYAPYLRGFIDLDNHEKNMRWACEALKKYQDPLIDERISQWKDGDRTEPDDILDVLVTLRDDNGKVLLCPEEIKAQLMELMIAAVDNPSNLAEWTLAEMLNQTEILNSALDELDNVVGNSRLVQESDIPKLNYLKACIKESFRLHPLNPFNAPHVSVSDTTVAGYFIPKGSHLLISRIGLGRNPRVWPEPSQFRPDRHLKHLDIGDVVLTDSDLRILSFSTGRRGCLGATLGSTITMMLLARMIHSFTYTFPPGITKVELEPCHDGLELIQPLTVMVKPRLGYEHLLSEL